MLSYCTWAQDAASTKTQKENRLVSGLTDHRYLSVTRARHRGASGQATNTRSNGSQRYVENHRQAGTIGPELLTTPPPHTHTCTRTLTHPRTRPPTPTPYPLPPTPYPLPPTPCTATTYGRRPTAPLAVRRCTEGDPLPPLPPRVCTQGFALPRAQCPLQWGLCTAGFTLPTGPLHCGGVLQDIHRPPPIAWPCAEGSTTPHPHVSGAVPRGIHHCPTAHGSGAVNKRSHPRALPTELEVCTEGEGGDGKFGFAVLGTI